MKKNIYNSPILTLQEFEAGDVITFSPGGGTELPPVWVTHTFEMGDETDK